MACCSLQVFWTFFGALVALGATRLCPGREVRVESKPKSERSFEPCWWESKDSLTQSQRYCTGPNDGKRLLLGPMW